MGRTLHLALAVPLVLAFASAAQADPSSVVPTAPRIVTGAGPGAPGGHVKTFDGTDASLQQSFFAYPAFSGGVFVASGDINGDGAADVVTGAGDGSAGGHVKVFDGISGDTLQSFFAYDGAFSGGVRVATGDLNGDGYADIVTGAGAGATGGHVKVFDGRDGAALSSFFAYDAFSGGVFVGAGDINGDGLADIVTGAGAGATGGHVKVFSGADGSLLSSFFAFDAFSGGVTVAAGDIDGDGYADIIAGAGTGAAGGHVKVFSGQTGELMHDFLAFDTGYSGGVSVGAGLYDGRASVLVGTLADSSRVSIFQDFDGRSARAFGALDAPSQPSPYASFFAYDGFTGGVYVAGSFGDAVPEPAVWMQLILGFSLAGLAVRRRRSVAA
jgi:hypothetical protein